MTIKQELKDPVLEEEDDKNQETKREDRNKEYNWRIKKERK